MDIREVSKMGGTATKKKYGSSHYSKMAKIRWDKVRAKKAAEQTNSTTAEKS